MTTPLRMMAVHAHPDDESSKGAATMARYLAEGHEVMVVTCTGGERGDVLNPEAQAVVDEVGLTEARRREMADAARILGVQHTWLGFEDSGYPDGDPKPPPPDGCFAAVPLDVATEPLTRLIRQFRPHVVTTYDENGGYPHPDHIRCHEITIAAVDAAMADDRPDLGEPWTVAKVYYNHQFSRERVLALHLAMVDADLDSPYHDWVAEIEKRPDTGPRITTRVPVAPWFAVRDEALRAHRTQVAPDSRFFAVPIEVQQEVWPTEDFELARSTVAVELPEDDLFAGLRTP